MEATATVSKTKALPLGVQEHNLKGSLQFSDKTPLIHRRVDVYAKGLFFNHKMGQFFTDKEGEYEFSFKKRRFSLFGEQDVTFKIYNLALPWYGKKAEERLVDVINFYKPFNETPFTPQTRPTQLLAYQERLPFLRQPEKNDWQPQQWAPYDLWLFVKGVLAGMVQEFFIKFKNPTIDDMIKEFSSSKFNIEHSEQFTIEMLTRGIYMPVWRKTDVPNEYESIINWDQYEQDPESPKLPNAGLRIKVTNGSFDSRGHICPDSQISIVSSWIKYKDEPARSASTGEKDFSNILYNFNSAALVRGEIDTHLQMHTEMEQVSIPADRYLIKNPIGALIKPHQRETQVINHKGATDIFGKEGVLNISALTEKSIISVIEDYLGGRDFLDFHPRKPLSSNDHFAIAQKIWWNAFSDVVDKFFDANKKEILDNWNEIFLFSESYHKHSVPYKPWDGVNNPSEWVDGSEVYNPSAPKRSADADGVVRSVRRITTVKSNPSYQEIENLKQFLRYTFCISMFRHSVVHLSQAEFGTMKTASLAPEGDGTGRYASTSNENALRQSRISKTLVSIDPKNKQAAIKNPHGDIHPMVLDALEKLKEPMEKLGFDIETVRHSVDL